MKGERAIATYRRLREQALWRLLAADNGPIVLGLLETHLLEDVRSLPASVLSTSAALTRAPPNHVVKDRCQEDPEQRHAQHAAEDGKA